MAVKEFYQVLRASPQDSQIADNVSGYASNSGGVAATGWFSRLVHGSADRLKRYQEYDIMEKDLDLSMALDLIAEEVCGNPTKTSKNSLFNLKIETELNDPVKPKDLVTLRAGLKAWEESTGIKKNLFNYVRNALKTGDTFLVRPEKQTSIDKKYKFVPSQSVRYANINMNDYTDVRSWEVDMLYNRPMRYNDIGLGSDNAAQGATVTIPKERMVRLSLMDETTEDAPFGKSVFAAIYRTFRQKQLLEDSLIVYRIQRAPERRVFYIDVGTMHPSKVKQYLTNMKNEMNQKKIPNENNGQLNVDAALNPHSMQEDFYFAQRPNGNTRVDVLPGGQGLGNLDDLEYFYRKLWRGLRIPASYMDNNSDGATFGDGKVGIAYMQEIKFSLYIERLQKHFDEPLDYDFKRFMRSHGIMIDPSTYSIELPPPSNFAKSRQQQMDADLINTYVAVADRDELSKRFALKRYLQLTPEEIVENEMSLREERGLPASANKKDLPKLYNPEMADMDEFDGSAYGGGGAGGGAGFGDMGGEGEDASDDAEGEDVENDTEAEGEDDAPEAPEGAEKNKDNDSTS